MVLVLNRFDECPDFITDVAYVDDGRLAHTVRRADEAAFARRAMAVEKERAIQENELQNRIELAKKEEGLIEQLDRLAVATDLEVVVRGLHQALDPLGALDAQARLLGLELGA